jgi:hypothetical protein
VRLVRLDEVLLALPKPPISAFGTCTLDAGDCLVLCAGFEDRALEVLKRIRGGRDGFKALLILYLPLIAENKTSKISDALRDLGAQVTEITYDRQNPSGFGAIAMEHLSRIEGKLAIDISAMSRLLIVQLLVALKGQDGALERSTILYTEARDYPPSEAEVRRLLAERRDDPIQSIHLLSSGVFEITVVPELSALSMTGEQTRLVTFPSFNVEQLTALRAELQPSRLVVAHGIPPKLSNAWRKDAIAALNHTSSLGAEEWEVSTLDYRETLDKLFELYNRHNERDRIAVCPTGSKMQAVAVGLFRAFLGDVQIVYPTPKRFYPENYTVGIDASHALDLRFFSQIK